MTAPRKKAARKKLASISLWTDTQTCPRCKRKGRGPGFTNHLRKCEAAELRANAAPVYQLVSTLSSLSDEAAAMAARLEAQTGAIKKALEAIDDPGVRKALDLAEKH